ncbi:MAG: Gfo/Idh/MocA family oxidoreductase [Eubacteriales bacterium]|nr:Gfo/Idh/MocA family oxidoreductase [Eubacteriales bacterium]
MTKNIGFIGYGLRSRTMMKAFAAIEADIRVIAIVDPRAEQIRVETADDPRFASTIYVESAEALLKMDSLDGVFIGTRCSLHAALAVKVLESGIPLYLEKPVCINDAQYELLKAAALGKTDRAVVSFPLRVSPVVREMKRIVERGLLGKLTMVQAINNVPYGSVYYHSWYRDSGETGGLFLQKATHDVDYIAYLTGEVPVDAFARTAKLHYKGDKPAGLHCPDCAEYFTCRESSYVVKHILKEEVTGDACCFAVDTGNEDCASAIFTLPSGAIVSYNQNFVVKKGAARRGCRLIGTDASVEFDFYTGEIREDRYDLPETVTHVFQSGAHSHFGGDEALALEYMGLMNGIKPDSDLQAGLNSAAVCLAAKRSSESGRLEAVRL